MASFVAVLIVAGMVASVLLTTGRTVGSEQAVLGSIDSAGTRSITVRLESGSGVTSSVLERLKNIEGISWAGAFGTAQDVGNLAIPGGSLVAARSLWTEDFAGLGIPAPPGQPGKVAWVSRAASDLLGLRQPAGALVTRDGVELDVAGLFDSPNYLDFLEPLVVIREGTGSVSDVSVLLVIAERPDLVAPLADLIATVLDASDPSKITVSTSERLATLRALVQGQLGEFGRSLVLVIFGLSAFLVAAVLYGLVMLRRKDFGRRRALGATQGLIVALLLLQVALLSVVGVVVGTAIALGGLIAAGDPLPGASFVGGVGILAVAVGVLAAITPALVASHRDPIIELRVP